MTHGKPTPRPPRKHSTAPVSPESDDDDEPRDSRKTLADQVQDRVMRLLIDQQAREQVAAMQREQQAQRKGYESTLARAPRTVATALREAGVRYEQQRDVASTTREEQAKLREYAQQSRAVTLALAKEAAQRLKRPTVGPDGKEQEATPPPYSLVIDEATEGPMTHVHETKSPHYVRVVRGHGKPDREKFESKTTTRFSFRSSSDPVQQHRVLVRGWKLDVPYSSRKGDYVFLGEDGAIRMVEGGYEPRTNDPNNPKRPPYSTNKPAMYWASPEDAQLAEDTKLLVGRPRGIAMLTDELSSDLTVRTFIPDTAEPAMLARRIDREAALQDSLGTLLAERNLLDQPVIE